MTALTAAPGRWASAAYAAGSFGTGVFSTVPTVLLLFFCTEILAIPAQTATLIVFLPKAWSIAWDPLVGAWSDRSTNRFGRRRPFLLAGLTGVALSFIATFTPPDWPAAPLALWVGASYFLLATLYSLFAVPYTAIPAEIGEAAPVRARLVAWRMFVAMIGVLVGAGIAPLLVASAGGGRHGYALMALEIGAACAMSMSLPVLMMRRRDRVYVPAPGSAPRRRAGILFAPLARPRFARLVAAYILLLTSVGVVSSATPYLVTRLFRREVGEIGTAMLAMLVVTTLCVPGWAALGRSWGEARMLRAAAIAFGAGATLLGLLALAGAPWWLALCGFAAVGAPFAGLQVLPYTMVSHLIREEAEGMAEGSFTGIWTAAEKLGLALGPAVTGSALWLAGSSSGRLAELTAVVPSVLALLALTLLGAQRAGSPPSTVRR